jgi:hypothetical protein
MFSLSRRALLASALAPKEPRLLFRYSDSSRLGRPFAKDPSAVFFRGQYWLYYSLPAFTDERKAQGWGIGIATSRDPRVWEKAGEIAAAGPHESRGICAPGALVLRDEVHIFYQTYGGREKDSICHAVSSDGLNFRRNPANPVLRATGAWNCGRAIDAEPVIHDGRLFLFAATRTPDFRRQLLFGASAPLQSAFRPQDFTPLSPDKPLLTPELPWERDCIEAPAVLRRGRRFYMFYAGGYNNEPQQVGCAESRDLVTWRRVSNEPFLRNGAEGEWNASESGHPGILVKPDGEAILLFQGNPDRGRTWHLAGISLGRGTPRLR